MQSIMLCKAGGKMYDKAQLLKGLQEGCVLQIINTKDTYGYEIVTTLQKKGFQSIKEGTIYPLLLRLEKNGYISSNFRISERGPARKYYQITDLGKEHLAEFVLAWQEVTQLVDFVFSDEKGEEK